MQRIWRKGFRWWSWKILKYGCIGSLCYGMVSCYFAYERAQEIRERGDKAYRQCQEEFAGTTHKPIINDGLIDFSKLPGFFYSIGIHNEKCIARVMEGSAWWTGTEIIPAGPVIKDSLPHWVYLNVNARLYRRTKSTEPYNVGRRTVDWPEELTIKLRHYPGLELWLPAPPPNVDNELSITGFVMTGWRRDDGTPRVISCNGLRSPFLLERKGAVTRDVLQTFSKSQLEDVDFGDLPAYCVVELHNFEFAGGDARVYLGVDSLREAPVALEALSKYLSLAIITRK